MLYNLEKVTYKTLRSFLKEFPADRYQMVTLVKDNGWKFSWPERERDEFAYRLFAKDGFDVSQMNASVESVAFSFLYDEFGRVSDELSGANPFYAMLTQAPGNRLRFHTDTMDGVVWKRGKGEELTIFFRPLVKTAPGKYRVIDKHYNLRFNYIDGELLVFHEGLREVATAVPVRQAGSDECHLYVGNYLYHVCEFPERRGDGFYLKRLVDMPGKLYEVVVDAGYRDFRNMRLVCAKSVDKASFQNAVNYY